MLEFLLLTASSLGTAAADELSLANLPAENLIYGANIYQYYIREWRRWRGGGKRGRGELLLWGATDMSSPIASAASAAPAAAPSMLRAAVALTR